MLVVCGGDGGVSCNEGFSGDGGGHGVDGERM